MLFKLLLIVFEFTADVNALPGAVSCPRTCDCVGDVPFFSTNFRVNCHGRSDIDRNQLTEQLDSLLSSSLTYGRLTSLSIFNSPLTHVPRSICRLTTLTRLHLDHNQLTRLPDNCFTNLTRLVRLSASDNYIETLQDGLFDGLHDLYFLNLSSNRISSIGLSVFATSTNLSSLRYIGLSDNNLTSLDSWPYYRAIEGSAESTVVIELERNRIQQLTNRMGYEGNYELGIPYTHISLAFNQLRHYSEMAKSWNLTVKSMSQCVLLNFILNGFNVIYPLISFHYNNFVCDCIDYHFYNAIRNAFRVLFFDLHCNFYDPVSKQLETVNALRLPKEAFICELSDFCPPGCQCVYRPANVTLHVYCSNANLSVLPYDLPTLPNADTRYKLDFSRNQQLARLQPRPYFNNATALDASRCGIDHIAEPEWKLLLQLSELNLDDNRIMSLPKSIAFLNISTKRLTIGSNPWDCSCNNRWMADWFASISDRLVDKEVYCNSPHRQKGKDMLQIPREEFCVDPTAEAVNRALYITLSSVAGAVVVLLSVVVIVYRLRIRLYTRWKIHPFDRDECLGEDMHYDVFLCCSSEDHQPHGMRVLNQIESKGYRVCYHLRDFLGGGAITDNMCAAVQRSKRTVCLLTENFLQSGYCMEEFQISYHHNVVEKGTKRLVVLMELLNRVDFYADDSPRTLSLRQYLRQYTYIDYTADDWLDKLLYALPLRGLNAND